MTREKISHKHTADKYQVPRRADESDGVHRRVLAADSLCLFLGGAGYEAITLSFS